MRKIQTWLSALIVGACALVGVQIPKISQDYQRQFNVRYSVLSERMRNLEGRAKDIGETSDEYVEKHYLSNSDAEVQYQGDLIRADFQRLRGMQQQLADALACSEWRQPLYWLLHKDPQIATDTWHVYQFGFFYNWAALVYALAGAATGWLLLTLAGALLQKAARGASKLAFNFWCRVKRGLKRQKKGESTPHHAEAQGDEFEGPGD